MALANVGWLLAESGRRVLVVDWDLEAPGLHRFFGIPDEEIRSGLIEAFYDYKDLLREESGSLPERLVKLEKYIKPVKPFTNGGSISILPAGCQDDGYAGRINAFSWEEFYAKWHGFGFIEHLKEQLRTFAGSDIVLVDSRTGVTDIGGICTLQLPDIVVLLFAMNDQNIAGVKSVAEKITKKAAELEGRTAPPTLILRPARVERSSGNQDKKLEWQAKAALHLGEFFPHRDAETVIAKKNIPYVSDFSYGEIPLAVVKDPLSDITDSFRDLADTITQVADGQHEHNQTSQIHGASRGENLARYLRIRTRLFFAKRTNVYFLLLAVVLSGIALWSWIKIRQSKRENDALNSQVVEINKKNVELNSRLVTLMGLMPPTPAPTPKGQFSINIASASQREMADKVTARLESDGFLVTDQPEVIKQPSRLYTTVIIVKYFYDEDASQAYDIAYTVGEVTGRTEAEVFTMKDTPEENENRHTFEIWFDRDYKP